MNLIHKVNSKKYFALSLNHNLVDRNNYHYHNHSMVGNVYKMKIKKLLICLKGKQKQVENVVKEFKDEFNVVCKKKEFT